jgi:hypothetical protein
MLPVNQNMIPFLDEVSMVINSRKDILCIRQTFIAPYPVRFATLVVILEMFGKIFIILIPTYYIVGKIGIPLECKEPFEQFYHWPKYKRTHSDNST